MPEFSPVRVAGTSYGRMLVLETDPLQGRPLIVTGLSIEHDDIMLVRSKLEKLPPGVMIDVGAHVGIWTLGLANYVSAIHAFEAQPFIINLLAGSLALNCIEHVELHDCALGCGRGILPLPKFNYQIVGSFGSVEFGNDQQVEYIGQHRQPSDRQVQVLALDEFGFEGVSFLKIDVEGMEDDVLDGAMETIERNKIPLMLVEYLKNDRWALRERLKSMGYSVSETSVTCGSYLCERL